MALLLRSVVLVVAAAACGSGVASGAPTPGTTAVNSLAATALAATPVTTAPEVAASATTAPASTAPGATAPTATDPLATAPVGATVSPAAGVGVPPPESAGATTARAATATSPRGVAPVTTVVGPAPTDPFAIYRGEVGLLGADDPVVQGVAPAPAVGAGSQPLTGWPGEVPARPAAVVKVDNSRPARPQAGIERADIVFEEEVEGGVTRLAAVFHSLGGVVGPVRSGRTTDIPVVVSLGSPLLIYSGANEVTDALLRRHTTVQNRAANRSSGYWRERSRGAPSNLYTDLDAHWASASGGSPPAQFTYRADGEGFPGAPASGITVSYRANRVTWAWNGSLWARSQGGAPHAVAAGGQLAVANVVVIHTRRVATGMVDSSGAEVPEFVFVGAGPATVYSDGKRLDGTWTRPTLASAATLTDAGGAVIALTPGRTWVQIVGS